MQCFNHHENAAVGLCKHCGKGLCPACATDLGYGLACREAHEGQVAAAHAMATKAARLQSVNRSNKYLGPGFFVVLGVLFGAWGIVTEHGVANFIFAMGAVFFLYGIFLFGVVRKAYAQPKA